MIPRHAEVAEQSISFFSENCPLTVARDRPLLHETNRHDLHAESEMQPLDLCRASKRTLESL